MFAVSALHFVFGDTLTSNNLSFCVVSCSRQSSYARSEPIAQQRVLGFKK